MFGELAHMRLPWHSHPLPVKRVLVINGHPDPGPERYCAALCAAYAEGAQASGCITQRLDVGAVTVPGAESGRPSWRRNGAAEIVERIWQADRLFIAFPMWLGGPPPALQLILEEFTRWQDAEAEHSGEPVEAKDAHIVVTASFPSLFYRARRGAPAGEWEASLSGLRIAQAILIGSMETTSLEDRKRWLIEVRHLGSSLLGCVPGKAVLRCSRHFSG
jgi:putative NADPH-quinone reductase